MMTGHELGFVRQVTVRNGCILRDGDKVLELAGLGGREWSEEVYRMLALDYPKFYKMDRLSRTGMLAVHVLLAGLDLRQSFDPYDIGVILANRHASLDADANYLNASREMSSPALFVYTLPNILIGEICIRYGFKGHNLFFIEEAFDAGQMLEQVRTYHRSGMAQAYICGYVDAWQDEQEAEVYLALPHPVYEQEI